MRSAAQQGVSAAAAGAQVDEAIDRWVWYAGWCDKFAQVSGNANPVSGPYFNISVPEPTGVVAVIAPQDSALLGLVSAIAPALVAGNTVVVVASERFPLSAISLAEVLATSDVPGGVVNVLTGSPAEIAPWLASHADVGALDLVGAGDLDWVELQIAAARDPEAGARPRSGERMPRRRACSASRRSPRSRPSGTPRASSSAGRARGNEWVTQACSVNGRVDADARITGGHARCPTTRHPTQPGIGCRR